MLVASFKVVRESDIDTHSVVLRLYDGSFGPQGVVEFVRNIVGLPTLDVVKWPRLYALPARAAAMNAYLLAKRHKLATVQVIDPENVWPSILIDMQVARGSVP